MASTMKKASHQGRDARGSRRRVLAASFVVTFAAHGAAGCKKQSVQSGEAPEPKPASSSRVTVSVSRAPLGDCQLNVDEPLSCPEGVHCNPPPPITVECPPDLRSPHDPPPGKWRPPGKEDWLRMRPALTVVVGSCWFHPARFCAPPGKPHECTPHVQSIRVPCTVGDAGAVEAEPFVYKDGLGICHGMPAFECTPGPGGCQDVPEGEVVPCP